MEPDPQQVPSHRYVTTENIHAGDIILEEEPWMWSLLCINGNFVDVDDGSGVHQNVCHYCLLSPGKLSSCSACKSAWYCGPTCQRADWFLRHKHGDCRLQRAIAQLKISVKNENAENQKILYKFEFLPIVHRLLLSSASKRLFFATERDQNGIPVSPLWHALINSPSSTDEWVNVDRKVSLCEESAVYADLVRMITWKDLPDKLLEKRILPSLVLLEDYGRWKTFVQSENILSTVPHLPKRMALGACLEMSKFPNNCNPNAVVINEGRRVRMIALENIPNLDAVRLSRRWGWYQPRLGRRTRDLYDVFGFDCYCSRCRAGDSGEITMFGLRCPKWAAAHGDTVKDITTPSSCDGVVVGLRRTDYDEIADSKALIEWHGAEIASVIDELRPLSAEVMKIPARERAVCQKCHARYSKDIMDSQILKQLKFMNRMNENKTNFIHDTQTREMCVAMVGSGAKKYIHPNNYVYYMAHNEVLNQCLYLLANGIPLDVDSLEFVQRNVQRVLIHIESADYTQIDLSALCQAAVIYSASAQLFRRQHEIRLITAAVARDGRIPANLHEQTADLVARVALAARKRLKPLLVHG